MVAHNFTEAGEEPSGPPMIEMALILTSPSNLHALATAYTWLDHQKTLFAKPSSAIYSRRFSLKQSNGCGPAALVLAQRPWWHLQNCSTAGTSQT